MKPIQGLFKGAQAALCLANEWRDTASYTVFTALSASQIWQGHWGWVPTFFLVPTMRELVRTGGWSELNPFQSRVKAGYNSPSIDRDKNFYASAFTAGSLGVVAVGMAAIFDTFEPTLWMAGGISSMLFSMGWLGLRDRDATSRDIPQIYFDKNIGMWDWPRKNKNGPTQTQKLKTVMDEIEKELLREYVHGVRRQT